MIDIRYEEWDEKFDCEDSTSYSPSEQEEEILKIIELYPNTVWTSVSFDNGGVYYVNRYDPKGDLCLFSDIKYKDDDEYEVCHLEPPEGEDYDDEDYEDEE
jgi:hypothetical protein